MSRDIPLVVMQLRSEHLPEVLAIHRRAFAGYPHVRLGDAYLERMLSWYATDPTAVALVAVSDERVVGYVFGTDRAGARRLGGEVRSSAVRGMLKQPWMLLRVEVVQAILRRLIPSRSGWAAELGPAVFSLVGIGVDETRQRKGIGARLIEAFEAAAAARGAESLSLSVERGNAAASRLYQKAGWSATEGGDSRLVTYVKALDRHEQASSFG